MILLDALYINNSGGKVLLDYLVAELEQSGLDVFYLFDDRCKNDFKDIPKNKKLFLKTGILSRYKFYKKNGVNFSKVLCFGNLPPSLKIKAAVYTYFHQKLFLEIPKEISIKDKIVYQIKTLFFNLLLKNTDFFIVQTQVMKDSFLNKIPKSENEKVLIIPFYPSIKKSNIERGKKDSFVYVSSGTKHKNHFNMIEAFCSYYDEIKHGELHLTIGKEFKDLNSILETRIKEGYPIINWGFIPRGELGMIYGKAAFSIYPSLTESFGLGLVEAIENQCDIIGSDLPYTYAVCKPSLVFDPTKIESIADAFKLAVAEEIISTEQLVFNEIDKLIVLLE
ncbi:glycosyltransferase [Flavobacterium sp. DSR3-2]|uniref:glycosyltransferase n=1 Tax=Flavobacterium sp. DSR3-2 TaxID=2804634 RepID=UPI003CF934AD